MSNDFFLKLDGIQGETRDEDHIGEIDVSGWSFGVNDDDAGESGESRAISGGRDNLPVFAGAARKAEALGGAGFAGSVRVGDLCLSKYIDGASAPLLKASTTRQKIAKAILTCRKASGAEGLEYLQIQLQDVMVASWNVGTSGADPVPVESLVLSYSRIEFVYQPQGRKGTAEGKKHAGWDRKLNSSL
ncbi:MAG TPA: type VI secretion system tube protein Hcp [Rhodanobacter sp.]